MAAAALEAIARTRAGAASAPLDEGTVRELEAAAAASDLVLAPILARAAAAGLDVERAAKARLLGGPPTDALETLPLVKTWGEHRARVELLVWEAGASARSVPDLGGWAWTQPFDARGSLRERALAARAFAIAADGASASAPIDPIVGLARHPEPIVWISAARALGRLALANPAARALVDSWLDGTHLGERRRAVTALGCMGAASADRLAALDTKDPWVIAALGQSIPILACEVRDLWERLAARLFAGTPGPEILWGVTEGLVTLARRGEPDRLTRKLLADARARALAAKPTSELDAMLWRQIRADTDFLDGLAPDASDPDAVLDREAIAAVHSAQRASERAAGVVRALRANLEANLRLARTATDRDERAAALAGVESASRAVALELWTPILGAAGRASRAAPLDDEAKLARDLLERAATSWLADPESDFTIRRTALRLLGHAADAGARTRAITALEGLPALPKRDAARLGKPIADVLWRVVDATRGATGEGWLMRRFAAWWAVAGAGLELLAVLGRAEIAARDGAEPVLAAARALRVSLSDPRDPGGRALLAELGAEGTALARGVELLALGLEQAARAKSSPSRDVLALALDCLGHARVVLTRCVADPAAALAPLVGREAPERALLDEALAVRGSWKAKPDEIAQRFADGLGPVLGPPVARALAAALAAHVGLDAKGSSSVEQVGGYRVIRRLGGGMGEVYLVRDVESERRFVLKAARGAFGGGTVDDPERLAESLAAEAKILKAIHHPNVASFIRYTFEDGVPYLVLEYLAGVDLFRYVVERPLPIDEAKPIVADVCAGLRALHARGLVHRDVKPDNVFLRIDFPEEQFRQKHRELERYPVLSAVVIDFGLAGRMAAPGGGEILGTVGFMPPEQAAGAPVVDPRADVFGLAATIYFAMTGRSFFGHLTNPDEYIEAHRCLPPLDSKESVRGLSRGLTKLLREATELHPHDRPDLATFASRFDALS
jgi:serine/threonine-protein kinase